MARRFSFGPEQAKQGFVRVEAGTVYSAERGFGFEPGAAVQQIAAARRGQAGCVSSAMPFYFSAALPEGNYDVTVSLGNPKETSVTTVKAELRRLMLQPVEVGPGRTERRTFTVNVRTPKIAGGGEVHLKSRERSSEIWNWDDKLTLEFNDARPSIQTLEIVPAPKAVTVYLLGDSTVCDQPEEPWNSWGQMLPRFFKSGVAIANNAESGESLDSSLAAHRLDKVLSVIRPGDYLFLQYGHNDMKEKGVGVGAFTTYKSNLRRFVKAARSHGAMPVLVTPMHRKSLDSAGKVVNTLGDYPEAVRQLAAEEKTALIDLNAMSAVFYEALGPSRIGLAFQDGTHHNSYGSYELAKCIVKGIRQTGLPLARWLVDDVPPFDPAHPDDPARFSMPASPARSLLKPDGN